MLSWSVFTAVFTALVYYYSPHNVDTPATVHQSQVLSTYDFIIVGGGSAGSVLARRLSDEGPWKVLLLEAGDHETALSKTPLLNFIQRNNSLTWNYTTVKQERACLGRGGVCEYPRGHCLGGSSSINAMLYVRGNRRDFDEWETEHGATNWGYQHVLPYFLKSENMLTESLAGSEYHRTGGLLSVQYSKYKTDIVDKIIKAGEEMKLVHRDYNGQHQTGIGRAQLSVNDTIRWSASSAYLLGANSANLHIVTGAKVQKILIDRKTKTARGVLYRKDDKYNKVTASKEVVLSAGAIDSPRLLMLSGVGPKEHLQQMKIPLAVDLPVGQNLQDHFFIILPFVLKNYTNLNPFDGATAENALAYARDKDGMYASAGTTNLAFINSRGDILSEPPDLQIHVFENSRFSGDGLLASATVLRPKSVGSVRLSSGDPNAPALIDPDYFADDDDTKRTMFGLKWIQSLMNTTSMSEFQPSINTTFYPLCSQFQPGSDDYLTCVSRNYTRTIYHPVGTCKMGPKGSPSSVVDPDLKVIGINKLRVVDASVMPTITRGNTNAPTIMIAEKAADIIKKYYSVKRR